MTDSRICKSIEQTIKEEWEGKCIFNSFSSQSRGVAIFLKKDNLAKILDTCQDQNGNILGLLLELEGKRILLEGVYGPNNDSPSFYENEVFEKIEGWEPSFSIFVGDWNVALDPNIDTKNYQNDNNPNARRTIKDKMEQYNLVDIFRELNPDEKTFSWHQFNQNKHARLDYFLVSSSLLPYIQNTSIIPGICSDHSPIVLDVDFSKFMRGRGFWKFNNSLLKDPDYVKLVKEAIKTVTCQYAKINGDENFFVNASSDELSSFLESHSPESLQTLDLKINPQQFLDVLLLEIRRITIKYSATKKRERIANEQLILHDIEILESALSKSNNDAFFAINEQLQSKKLDLEAIYEHQAQGAFVRARARYKIEGEKPTRLFCSLEKHNAVMKYIPQLKVLRNDVEVTITEQKEVEKETYCYYNDLFSNQDHNLNLDSIEQFLGPEASNSCPKISECEKEKMNESDVITCDELTKYLKRSKNNVAPGTTGYTNEFYKFFWRDLKHFVTNAINHGYENGMLSITQRLGIITLIPKGEKDKNYLKNWRPLTLLNTLYKMVSGCIAERIKPHLNKIINGDQKGFVAGRYIGEAVRTTYDIIQWAKDNGKTGVILLIDFEKAYDSVSFSYIEKCMKFFNFGENLIKWVNILLHNFFAVVNHCGNISKKMNIGRGCRQGDPIASYLFIICIEVMAHKLRTEKTVESFVIGQGSHTLELYADDCSIFLQPKSESLRSAVQILSDFFSLSGLKISITKTKAIWFGVGYNNTEKLCPDLGLDWGTDFRLLGVDFDGNLEKMDKNLDSKIDEIQKLLNCWIYRSLTVYGRMVVVKTLALSKLSHVALIIPCLKQNRIKEIENIIFKFIWGNKPDKVSRNHAKLPESSGGLGMIDVKDFWQSFRFSWFRRLINTDSYWPNILFDSISKISGEAIDMSKLFEMGPSKFSHIGKKLKNCFWKEVFMTEAPTLQGALFCHPEKILLTSFWDNPLIVRNRPIKRNDFPEIAQKITYFQDFFKIGTKNLLSKVELEEKYNLQLNQETYIELSYIVKSSLQKIGLRQENLPIVQLPIQPILTNIATLVVKGCNRYYKLIRKKKALSSTIHERETIWHNEINSTFGIQFWNKVYFLTNDIKNDNRLKWVQFQISRNSLFTNHKVNKFNPNVSPLCRNCNNVEKISHLMWHCGLVMELWQDIQNFLEAFQIYPEFNIKIILFGMHKETMNSVTNFVILAAKGYIWKTKFDNTPVSFNLFKKYLKMKLEDLKNSYEYVDKMHLFDQWINIFASL